MFKGLKEYYMERDRLVKEVGMNYMDACNRAWREVMEKGTNKQKIDSGDINVT